MSELRLVAPAVVVWAAAALVIVHGWGLAAVLSCGAAAYLCVVRQEGLAILTAGLGLISAAVAKVRVSIARSWDFTGGVVGAVAGEPKELTGGTWLVLVRPEGYPDAVPVFARDLPDGVVTGAIVSSQGRVGESTIPGVGSATISGAVEVLHGPTGVAALAGEVRANFVAAVHAFVGRDSVGLIPGMVLGDTSAQTVEEKQEYIATGLSHLSAVSGSNCMYVAAAALFVARMARLGLRAQLVCAGVALMVYAALVGPQPSVLRATVSGLVGLVAIISSSRAEPIHALCLSVVGLVLVDSGLAVDYAFALSVAATAGIIALSPVIYRAIAYVCVPIRAPDLLLRVVAVAIAADMVTAPIIAAMVGRVSLVSVLANVAAAPVTGLITVLGFVAAVLAQIPVLDFLAAPVLWVIHPLTWWIRNVARVLAGVGWATVPAKPTSVCLIYGWILAAILAPRQLRGMRPKRRCRGAE
ncbi:ComEC/Rec2 family competence protein [Corynebacterium aquatimens]|uniref:Competence protein ComEC n=1 Tax=Corynebacterium aquatimens TaxID=1190508 RepID=A0A931E435_9CORY|nr:ComEC/Rec2 family competence protein [Corynebacterium aquatimens]MBG6122118.1 competence protein ComEC [Corynebacterium aquatimens]WJY65341.1 ComEC family competence protein [Corynebacterium aquatimens]